MKIIVFLFLTVFSLQTLARTKCDCDGNPGKTWINNRQKNATYGGCVSDGAYVDERVFIAASAKVCGSSVFIEGKDIKIIGNGRVLEYATLMGDNIIIKQNAVIKGDTQIGSNVTVLFKTLSTGYHSNKNYNGIEERRKSAASAQAAAAKRQREEADRLKAQKEAQRKAALQAAANEKARKARQAKQKVENTAKSLEKKILNLHGGKWDNGSWDREVEILQFPSVCLLRIDKISSEYNYDDGKYYMEAHQVDTLDLKEKSEYPVVSELERSDSQYLNYTLITAYGSKSYKWEKSDSFSLKSFRNNYTKYPDFNAHSIWIYTHDKSWEVGDQIYQHLQDYIKVCRQLSKM